MSSLALEGNTTYTYDARNSLTKAFAGSKTFRYTYDGFGNKLVEYPLDTKLIRKVIEMGYWGFGLYQNDTSQDVKG